VALSRNDLVAELANKTGSTKKDVDEFVTAFAELVIDSVAKGEKISIPGVLSVELVERAARTGRNPATGETIDIPAGKGVKVSAGSRLKAAAKSAK
jgi:DNA-binding protein HU-beta